MLIKTVGNERKSQSPLRGRLDLKGTREATWAGAADAVNPW